jgi:hypothetical protein
VVGVFGVANLACDLDERRVPSCGSRAPRRVVTRFIVHMKTKKERRVYLPRVLGSGQVMMPADLKRLHKYMLEIEHISVISDEVRAVVEEEWPELAHKLPPKAQH